MALPKRPSKKTSAQSKVKGKAKGPAALRNMRRHLEAVSAKAQPAPSDADEHLVADAQAEHAPSHDSSDNALRPKNGANAQSLPNAQNLPGGQKLTSGQDSAKENSAPLPKPEILAPAGDMPAALAALAAGADAIYLGLKHFSARMQAENFSVTDVARLTDLAHEHGRKIYVTLNSLVKPNDIHASFRLIKRLALAARPDALIIQDPGIIPLALEAGFEGELHLSTLANITHPKAMQTAKELGAHRIILPRELSFEEVQLMGHSRPQDLDLELFVHGALCYCVSGRCWWSSYMGGKSGLRGRCVQPCRRVYTQRKQTGRFFSCLDLSLASSVRQLLDVPGIRSWKIEGRKKSPHYVYNVVQGYRLLCDAQETTPALIKEAEELFTLALGRQRTPALFNSLKDLSPNLSKEARQSHTGSGLLVGFTVRHDLQEGGMAGSRPTFSITPNTPLIAKDFLRVGHEDENWHCTITVPRGATEGVQFTLPLPHQKLPRNGTPVYLIDRKEPAIQEAIASWEKRLAKHSPQKAREQEESPETSEQHDIGSLTTLSAPNELTTQGATRARKLSILVRSSLPQGRESKEDIRPGAVQGLWVSSKAIRDISKTLFDRISWWLPPVVWPNEEESLIRTLRSATRKGARHFVCNSPWQTRLFDQPEKLSLTAGPFCNIANAAAIFAMRQLGFKGAIVSPELSGEEFLSLPSQSALPLGIVIDGWWPMGISRFSTAGTKSQQLFSSPKGEDFWHRQYGQNAWVYPAWPLDISEKQHLLEQAGYTTFITLQEHPPQALKTPKRTSQFNWDLGLL